ncbi:MAG: DDE-type integrase/transposase/recombinase [Nitrososphaerales archaeon]
MNPAVFDYRVARGEAIAKVESNVRRIDQNEYWVKSQSGKGGYRVLSTELGWNCACPDYQYRQVKCKHIVAVELSQEIRRRIENAKRIVPLDYQTCLMCGSEDIRKDGVRHNRNGDIQRFECRGCGKKFVFDDGFRRMGATPQAITGALQLYFSGESLRSTQKFLRLQGVNVSHQTIHNWIARYVSLMKEYLDKITPQVSDTWRADELWVKVKGDMKYLFAMMDDESRFWIAQQVSNVKQGANASRLFMEAKRVAGKAPKTLITDALPSYVMAANLDFPHAAHVREIAFKGKVHNNKMERMNGEVRDREKVMRSLKTTDSPIFDGLQLYHNFFRPHMGLKGKTPAEAAGITIEGENKWETVIRNASHSKRLNNEAEP